MLAPGEHVIRISLRNYLRVYGPDIQQTTTNRKEPTVTYSSSGLSSF